APLRRTRTAGFTVDQTIDLETAERDPERAAAAVIPLADMLPRLASVVLSARGVRRALNGCGLSPRDTAKGIGLGDVGVVFSGFVRLLEARAALVGVGRPAGTPGLVPPAVAV